MSEPVKETALGVEILVKVTAGSRKEGFVRLGGQLKAYVHAPRERGKANDALVQLLSRGLSVPLGDINFLSGQTSQLKRILIKGVTKREVERLFEG